MKYFHDKIFYFFFLPDFCLFFASPPWVSDVNYILMSANSRKQSIRYIRTNNCPLSTETMATTLIPSKIKKIVIVIIKKELFSTTF